MNHFKQVRMGLTIPLLLCFMTAISVADELDSSDGVMHAVKAQLGHLGLVCAPPCEHVVEKDEYFTTVYLGDVAFRGSHERSTFAANVSVPMNNGVATIVPAGVDEDVMAIVTDLASVALSPQLENAMRQARKLFSSKYPMPRIGYQVTMIGIRQNRLVVSFERVMDRGTRTSNVYVDVPR